MISLTGSSLSGRNMITIALKWNISCKRKTIGICHILCHILDLSKVNSKPILWHSLWCHLQNRFNLSQLLLTNARTEMVWGLSPHKIYFFAPVTAWTRPCKIRNYIVLSCSRATAQGRLEPMLHIASPWLHADCIIFWCNPGATWWVIRYESCISHESWQGQCQIWIISWRNTLGCKEAGTATHGQMPNTLDKILIVDWVCIHDMCLDWIWTKAIKLRLHSTANAHTSLVWLYSYT